MLVASMSLEEIKRNIEKEASSVSNKMLSLASHYKKFVRRYKVKDFVRFHEYTSLSKNRWLFKFHYDEKIKDIIIGSCIIYKSHSGYSAIVYNIHDKIIYYHTPHFLKRYNERLNLNLTNIVEKMKLIMLLTRHVSHVPIDELKPGIMKFFGTIPQGVVLGTYIQNLRTYKMNTFVTHDMLHHNQQDLVNTCAARLDKYLPFAEMGD